MCPECMRSYHLLPTEIMTVLSHSDDKRPKSEKISQEKAKVEEELSVQGNRKYVTLKSR